jgi:hypothetical protein
MAWKWNPIKISNSIRMSDFAVMRRMKNPNDWYATRPNMSLNEMRTWFRKYGAPFINNSNPGAAPGQVKFSDFDKMALTGVSVYATAETYNKGYSEMDDACIRVLPHGLMWQDDSRGTPKATSGVDVSIEGGGHTHSARKSTGSTGGTKVRVYTTTPGNGVIVSSGKISGKNLYPSFGHNSVSATTAYYGSGSYPPLQHEQWEGTPLGNGTRYKIRVTDILTGSCVGLDFAPGRSYFYSSANSSRAYCVIRGGYDHLGQGDGQTTQGSPSNTNNRPTLHLRFRDTQTSGSYDNWYPTKNSSNEPVNYWSAWYHFWNGPSDPEMDRYITETSDATNGYKVSYGYSGVLTGPIGENPNR